MSVKRGKNRRSVSPDEVKHKIFLGDEKKGTSLEKFKGHIREKPCIRRKGKSRAARLAGS